MGLHPVGKDDAADDDGHGGGKVAGEAKGGSRGGDVAGLDLGLQGYERSLKVRTHADAGDDLEEDEARPGGIWREVDVEAEAEGEEEHSEPDGLVVAPSFTDEDSSSHGNDGEGYDKWEEVDAGKEGRSAEYGLEIEREEVRTGHEDEAVAEDGNKNGDIGARRENVERYDGVLSDATFNDEEDADGDDTKNNETDSCGGRPREGDAAELEAQ